MFSRFLDYICKSNEDNSASSSSVNTHGNNDSMTSQSSCEQKGHGKDYLSKYDYLDHVTRVDMRGLSALSEDLHQSVEILKNSYLSIVNSLVILNERRRKRMQQSKSRTIVPNQQVSTDSSKDFINSKVANNFRNSEQLQEYLNKTKACANEFGWSIEKFCDPETREQEFQRLFQEAEHFEMIVERIKLNVEPINLTRFTQLAKQGKNLLGIVELLNNNYSTNFLDIFRLR